MKNKGKLFLIPNFLGPSIQSHLTSCIAHSINQTDIYIAEHAKEARRSLKNLGIKKPLQELTFYELNKHTSDEEKSTYIQPLIAGKNVGLISDAGCPGVADPGAELVRSAHANRIQVVPLIGPSSILLALMASGLNGQHFLFHGYLPKERKARVQQIKKMEAAAERLNQTQIFIETPYRNDHLIEDLLLHCKSRTQLCIAANLTLENEFIRTQPIDAWKKQRISLSKQPAVFLLYYP